MDKPRTIPIVRVAGDMSARETTHDGEADTPVNPARRVLLKWMAAATALAGAGCSGPPDEAIVPYAHMPEGGPGDDPVFYATAVTHAGYAVPVLVETHDGRPTKIEGNPRHAMSLGAADARTQAVLWQLWDPDRSNMVFRAETVSEWDSAREALLVRRAHLEGTNGAGLHVLTGNVTSPTLLRQLDALAARYPAMQWHRHDPAYPVAAEAGAERALGLTAQPMYHLDHARVIVSVGTDLFMDTPAGLRFSRDVARGRGDAKPAARARLYAVEAMPGLTGAMADQRWSMTPAEMGALLKRLAIGLGVLQNRTDAAHDGSDAQGWESHLLDALRADNGQGHALIIAGPALPAAAHALVWAINAQLGAVGKLVTPVPVRGASGLGALTQAIHAGTVDTLLVLDANPVYDAPGNTLFANALRQVDWSMHVGLYRDETARICTWHVPRAHELETWGDALAWDGTPTIQQPMIAPLHGGISPYTVLQVLVDGNDTDALAVVRQTWRTRWGDSEERFSEQTEQNQGATFESRWRAALRNGFVEEVGRPVPVSPDPIVPDAVTRAVLPDINPAPTGDDMGSPALTMQLLADPYLGAGAMANNAWLQELPRPLTRLTWDNAAFLGPDTARRYQIETGDVVTLKPHGNDGAEVQVPVHLLPGHAEGLITLHLGYGRRHAGSVGTGVGVDAYALQGSDAQGDPLPTLQAVLTRTDGRHRFAHVQSEMSTHGRDIVRVEALDAVHVPPGPETPSLYPKVAYLDYAWAMTIDLDQCIGCNACTIACQAENNIPVVGAEQVMNGRVMHWIRVDVYREQEETLFQPVPCMHCEDAPCEAVCPTGATVHDSEGLNAQVYNRCVGTRFCSNNCPYKVRRFNFFDFADHGESAAAHQNPDVTVRQRGVMEKCTYCVQRISRARIQAQKENRELHDGEVVTACQATCPTQAIVFGNLNEPGSQVNASRTSPRAYTLLEELNTRPRTRYLARREDAAARLEPDDA